MFASHIYSVIINEKTNYLSLPDVFHRVGGLVFVVFILFPSMDNLLGLSLR